MNEKYVNMRLKVPHFIHAQLVRKQAERLRHGLDPLSLSDLAIVMLTEACIQEHWQRPRVEEENVQSTVPF